MTMNPDCASFHKNKLCLSFSSLFRASTIALNNTGQLIILDSFARVFGQHIPPFSIAKVVIYSSGGGGGGGGG